MLGAVIVIAAGPCSHLDEVSHSFGSRVSWLFRAGLGAVSIAICVEGAERRLLGSIKRGEPRPRLAERVRTAQLGCFKATDLVVDLPTDVDDAQVRRHRENLGRERTAWERMSVDDIIAFYSQRPMTP